MQYFFFGLLFVSVSYSQITAGVFQATIQFRNTLQQAPPFISPCCDEIYNEVVTIIATTNSLNFTTAGSTGSCGPAPSGWFFFGNLTGTGTPNCYLGSIIVSSGGSLGQGRIFYDGTNIKTSLFANSATQDCSFPQVNLTCTGNADTFYQPLIGVIGGSIGPAKLTPVSFPGTLTFRNTLQQSPPFFAPCCSEIYTANIQFVATSNSISITTPGSTQSCGPSPSATFSFENLQTTTTANCYVGNIFITPSGGSKTSNGQGRIYFDGNAIKTAIFGNSANANCDFPANNILDCSGGNSTTFYQPMNGFAAPPSAPSSGSGGPTGPTQRPIIPYSGLSGGAVVGILIAIYFVIILVAVILCVVICKKLRK